MAAAAISSVRTVRRLPLPALPTAVLAPLTITASVITFSRNLSQSRKGTKKRKHKDHEDESMIFVRLRVLCVIPLCAFARDNS
jgi:hypothetical protein